MLTVEEAQSRILAAITPLPAEAVSLSAADYRVLAEDLISEVDLPPFDNSAMDGYAVRARDVAGASSAQPVTLPLAGVLPAGAGAEIGLPPGACLRIFTGSKIPSGADAVVMQEDTRAQAQQVDFLDAPKPWENVRFRGEDLAKGSLAAKAGQRARPSLIGLLAATGRGAIPVFRKPKVGVIATGSELREPGEPLRPGEIHESNRWMLASLIRAAASAESIVFPLAPDSLEATQAALQSAFSQCDAVVTSGGASVGDLDYVKEAFQRMGGELAFWKIAMKPGKPFLFGHAQGKPLFGLPGNPVSAFVTFLLMARPALLRMQGLRDVSLPAQCVRLSEAAANRSDRRLFMRMKLAADGRAASAGGQASHFLSSLASCDGLLDVPPNARLEKGSEVRVLRWEL